MRIAAQITMILHQMSGPRTLRIEKCFGMLLAPGRHVRNSDMHLIEMTDNKTSANESSNRTFTAEAIWNPNSVHFEALNTETPRGLTLAIQ